MSEPGGEYNWERVSTEEIVPAPETRTRIFLGGDKMQFVDPEKIVVMMYRQQGILPWGKIVPEGFLIVVEGFHSPLSLTMEGASPLVAYFQAQRAKPIDGIE